MKRKKSKARKETKRLRRKLKTTAGRKGLSFFEGSRELQARFFHL